MGRFLISVSRMELLRLIVLPLKQGTYSKLKDGLLKNGYVLFGDNAYLNSPYMATPYSNVSGNPNKRSEDNYNFFIHSCASEWNVLLACLWLDGVY
jgi:hypothetical protein